MRHLVTIRSFLKMTSLAAYFLIFLNGMFISIPFIVWLIFSLLDFGSTEQIFSVLGLAGVIGLLMISREETDWKKLLAEVLCFLCMASPIAWRMLEAPLSDFNYRAFILPAAIFAACFTVSICISCYIYFSGGGNESVIQAES